MLLQWFLEAVLVLRLDYRSLLLNSGIWGSLEQDWTSVHPETRVARIRLASASNVR
jgi:hypothetical protein